VTNAQLEQRRALVALWVEFDLLARCVTFYGWSRILGFIPPQG
jgi:hypothetical protein